MTIQEIYNSQPVRKVEYMILDCQWQSEKGWGMETGRVAIQKLLSIRKTILDEMFEMDEQYLQLLSDFNKALKQQMIEMRKRTIALYESVVKTGLPGTIEVEGKCFWLRLSSVASYSRRTRQTDVGHTEWINRCLYSFVP